MTNTNTNGEALRHELAQALQDVDRLAGTIRGALASGDPGELGAARHALADFRGEMLFDVAPVILPEVDDLGDLLASLDDTELLTDLAAFDFAFETCPTCGAPTLGGVGKGEASPMGKPRRRAGGRGRGRRGAGRKGV